MRWPWRPWRGSASRRAGGHERKAPGRPAPAGPVCPVPGPWCMDRRREGAAVGLAAPASGGVPSCPVFLGLLRGPGKRCCLSLGSCGRSARDEARRHRRAGLAQHEALGCHFDACVWVDRSRDLQAVHEALFPVIDALVGGPELPEQCPPGHRDRPPGRKNVEPVCEPAVDVESLRVI